MDYFNITYKKFHNISIDEDSSKINLLDYEWINNFINMFNSQNIDEWVTKVNFSNNFASSINDNIFISPEIKNWIMDNKFYNKEYRNNKYGKINIYAIDADDYKSINIADCMKIIQVLYDYSIIKTKVHVVIILTPFKKELPKDNSIIEYNNVNSGMSNGRKVIVWRKEEAIKVLIHELIHHYELDFGSLNEYETSERQLQKKINCERKIYENIKIYNKKGIIINEAITETLATIINCIIYHIHTNKDITKLLIGELWHTFIQVSKILNHYNFKNADEFFGLVKNNIIMTEGTNVFSYYIVKSFLLCDLPNIIELLDLKNEHNINNYIKLLNKIDSFNKKEYIHIINWLLDQKIPEKSLKMTITLS
jgi:hypothetical protein